MRETAIYKCGVLGIIVSLETWTARTINNEEGSEPDNGAASSCVRDAPRGFLEPADCQKNRLQSERGRQDPTEE